MLSDRRCRFVLLLSCHCAIWAGLLIIYIGPDGRYLELAAFVQQTPPALRKCSLENWCLTDDRCGNQIQLPSVDSPLCARVHAIMCHSHSHLNAFLGHDLRVYDLFSCDPTCFGYFPWLFWHRNYRYTDQCLVYHMIFKALGIKRSCD